MKKIISFIIALAMTLSCITVPVLADDGAAPIHFKFYKINGDNFEEVGEDKNLEKGQYYKVSILMDKTDNLYGIQMPIHFNNKTVRLVNGNLEDGVQDGVIDTSVRLIGSNTDACLSFSRDTYKKWPFTISYNENYPYVSNKESLISFCINYKKMESCDWAQTMEVCSITFKAIGTGDADFRPATDKDDNYDHACPEGFLVSTINWDEADPDEQTKTYNVNSAGGNKQIDYAPVTSVKLEPESLSIRTGESKGISATVNEYADISGLEWKSDDNAIATVTQNGTVTGKKVGQTIITATSKADESIFATCQVSVTDPNTPTVPEKPRTVKKTGSSVSLTWAKSTGEKGVSGYKIYRNGEYLKDVSANEFTDTNLETDTEYEYAVSAFYMKSSDEILESEKSETIKITPKAPQITSVTPEDGQVGGNNLEFVLTYGNDYNNDGAKLGMKMIKEDDPDDTVDVKLSAKQTKQGNQNAFVFTPDFVDLAKKYEDEIAEGAYTFIFTVTDSDGFEGAAEAEYTLILNGPNVGELTVNENPQQEEIYLSWECIDRANTKGYYLYKYDKDPFEEDAEPIAKIKINGMDTTEYTDRDVIDEENADDTTEKGPEYYYRVTAYNKFGLEGEFSDDCVKQYALIDNTPPEIISILPASNEKLHGVSNSIKAVFNDNIKTVKAKPQYYDPESKSGDGWVDFGEFDVVDEQLIFNIDTAKLPESAVVKGDESGIDGILKVRVLAYDKRGNFKDKDTVVREYRVDNKAPETPVIDRQELTGLKMTITWNDDPDCEYYIVEQKEGSGEWVQIGDKIKDVCGKVIEGLKYSTQYTFRVKAVDDCGNESGYAETDSVRTQSFDDVKENDSERPVVADIQPVSGMLKNTAGGAEVRVVVRDNIGVSGVKLQYSEGDGWKDYETVTVDPIKSAAEVSFRLKNIKDGWIKVRAIAVDHKGNSSVIDSNMIIRDYGIDTTAPDMPTGLKASYDESAGIYIEWEAANDDLDYYVVERSETEDFSNVVTVRSRLDKISCYDTKTFAGKNYYYRVKAVDKAGNEGEYAYTEEVRIPEDKTPPQILGFSPADGTYISKNKEIVVAAQDIGGIESIVLEYSADDGNTWTEYGSSRFEDVSKFKISSHLTDGEYKFRAKVADTKSNYAYSEVHTYTIDNSAPVIGNVGFDLSNDKKELGTIKVSWTCSDNKKLYGQKVYYKTQNSGYFLAAEVAPNEGNNNYSVTIEDLRKYDNTVYSIKIVAEDEAENTATSITEDIKFDNYDKDTIKPTIVADIPGIMQKGVTYKLDASGSYDNNGGKLTYEWRVGSKVKGTESTYECMFDKTTNYKITLKVKDEAGNTSKLEKTVKVVNSVNTLKKLKIKIIDDLGNAVPDADIYLGYNTANITKLKSDLSGECNLELEAGGYSIGVYKDGYLPNDCIVNVYKKTDTAIIRIIKKSIVIGSVNIRRVSPGELKDNPDIDFDDILNNNVFEYKISLIVSGEKIDASGIFKKDEKENKPVIISKSYRTRGGNTVNSEIYWYDFTEDSDLDENGNYNYDSEKDKDKAPKSLVAYVETPGNVSWLKEFFDVSVTVANQASEKYELADCNVTLNYPDDGLTLVSAAGGETSERTVSLGTIKGQQSASARWLLRGDKEGEYQVSADFSGTLKGFNKEISQKFICQEPLKVYGSEGLRFVVECEDEISDTDDYAFRVGLKNVKGITRYRPVVTLNGNDAIKPMEEDYQNYIERENSSRFASEPIDDRKLQLGETLYSNFTIDWSKAENLSADGKINKAELKRLVVESVGGNVSLPIEVKEAKFRSFHSRNIELFCVNSSGQLEPFNTVQVRKGEKIKLAAKISEILPGAKDYTPSKGICVYLDGKKLMSDGTAAVTNENGVVIFDYDTGNVQFNNGEKQKTVTLNVKGNRTQNYEADIQVINNTANVSGHVYDTYGNTIDNVKVVFAQGDVTIAETMTDSSGYYEVKELETGEYDVRLTKEKYQDYSQTVSLQSGDTDLSFTMKRIPVKPKILSVNLSNIYSDKIIIPQGLDITESVYVNAAVTEGKITQYVMKITDPAAADSNEREKLIIQNNDSSTSKPNVFKLSFKELKPNTRIEFYAVADQAESDHYVLPVEVIESQFVSVLNKMDRNVNVYIFNRWFGFDSERFENNNGIRNGELTGFIRLDKLRDGSWLSDDTMRNSWKQIFNDKLKHDWKLEFEGSITNLATVTELDYDWFSRNILVDVGYDFRTGDFTLFGNKQNYGMYPNYSNYIKSEYKPWNYEYYDNDGLNVVNSDRVKTDFNANYGMETTGYFNFDETVEETTEGWNRNLWLQTWNGAGWGVKGSFVAEFSLNDERKWNGSVDIGINEDQRYDARYLRTIWDATGGFFGSRYYMPGQVLEGRWTKTLEGENYKNVSLDGKFELNDAKNLNPYYYSIFGKRFDDKFKVHYNSSTQGSWKTRNFRISLCSDSINEIELLPETRINGITSIWGDYNLWGWKQGLIAFYNLKDNNSPSLQSLAYNLPDDSEEVFEPIQLFSAEEEAVSDKNTIKPGVFDNSYIAAADVDGKLMTLYLDYGKDRTSVNSAALSYMKLDNKALNSDEGERTTKIVYDDKTGDFEPAITETPNGAVAVWTNFTNPDLGKDKTEWSFDEINDSVKNLQIYASVYDKNNDTWSDQIQISKNSETDTSSGSEESTINYMNTAPAVTAYSGKNADGTTACAAWIANLQGDLNGDSNDGIMYSFYRNGSWTEAEFIPLKNEASNGRLSDIKMKEYNGELYLLYSVENDVELPEDSTEESNDEQDTYSIKKHMLMKYDGESWSSAWKLMGIDASEDYAEFVEIGDELQVLITSGTEVYRVDTDIDTKKTLEVSTLEYLRDNLDVKAVQKNDETALVWVTSSNEGPKMYTAFYTYNADENTYSWTNPTELSIETDQDTVIKNITPVFTEDNSLRVLYNRHKYTVDDSGENVNSNVMLCQTVYQRNADPQITALIPQNSPAKDSSIKLIAEIQNPGIDSLDLNGYRIILKGKHGENEVTLNSTDLNGSVASGEVYQQSIEWLWNDSILPEDNLQLTAVIAKGDKELGRAECELVLKDILIDKVSHEFCNDKLKVTVDVKNRSTVAAGSVKVNINIEGLDEESTVIPSLAPGETKSVVFDITDAQKVAGADNSTMSVSVMLNNSDEISNKDNDESNNKIDGYKLEKDNATIKVGVTALSPEYDGVKPNRDVSAAIRNARLEATFGGNVTESGHSSNDSDISLFAAGIDFTDNKTINVAKNIDVNLSVKGDSILERNVTLNAEDIAKGNKKNMEVVVGDVYKDNACPAINIYDVAMIRAWLNTAKNDGTGLYNPIYDFNGDGVVGVDDFGAVLMNVGFAASDYDKLTK